MVLSGQLFRPSEAWSEAWLRPVLAGELFKSFESDDDAIPWILTDAIRCGYSVLM